MTAFALAAAFALSLPFLLVLAGKPVLRRLALRNAVRRPREALLVVVGSMLGATIITGSFIVGDSVNASVRQLARTHLGPIDELVVAPAESSWPTLAQRLRTLPSSEVDGVLPLAVLDAPAVSADRTRAAPRAQLVGVDFPSAERFGGDRAATGVSGPTPPAGHAAVTTDLARTLGIAAGERILVYAYGRSTMLVVDRVLPRRGVAGYSLGALPDAPNVLVSPVTFASVSAPANWRHAERFAPPQYLVAVSNRGGIESGAALTSKVASSIASAGGGLGGNVIQAKKLTLEAADAAGKGFGDMYTSTGSFGVLAGLLLLVNLFVMLAAERKSELGMARAVGMRRRELVGAFAAEGWLYALAASALGTAAGIGLGRLLVAGSQSAFATEHNPLEIVFVVRPRSVAEGFAIGLAISIVTITATSVRVSRLNIIKAIRDIPEAAPARLRRRWVVLGSIAAALGLVWTVSAVSAEEPFGLLLGPTFLLLGLVPPLGRLFPWRAVAAVSSALVIAWGVTVFAAFSKATEGASVMAYVVQGVVLTAAAVTLAAVQQERLAALLGRIGFGRRLALRLGLAYPMARRSRTALTVAMYALVVFILVFITTLAHMIDSQVTQATRNVSGGFDVAVSSSTSNPIPLNELALRRGVVGLAPLATVQADFSVRGSEPEPWPLTAFDRRLVDLGPPKLEDRGSYPTDEAAYRAVLTDPSLAIADPTFLQRSGGPAAFTVRVGDRIVVTDPYGGGSRTLAIAAIGAADYPITNGVLYGQQGARSLFGDRLVASRAYVKLVPGADGDVFAWGVQGTYAANGTEASSISSLVNEAFATTRQIFQLFQGYLALGLVVGIAGLAVVMVRAVRERRRQIGALRALGFPTRTIGRAFAIEAGFIALQGTAIGATLALLTLYDIVAYSDAFGEMTFSVPTVELVVLLAGTLAASLVATLAPAVSATRIRPAVALRVTD